MSTRFTATIHKEEVMNVNRRLGQTALAIALALVPLVSTGATTCDDFEGSTLNSSLWNPLYGDWSVSAGRLMGHWPIGSANRNGGILVLTDPVQPVGDFIFEVDMVVETPAQGGNRTTNGGKIELWHSYQNRLFVDIDVESPDGFVRGYAGGSKFVLCPYYPGSHIRINPGEINHIVLERSGDQYCVYLNGYFLCTFQDSYFGGDVKLGLGTYGTCVFENVCLTTYESLPTCCELAADCSTPNHPDNCTVGLWHFDEGGGDAILDASDHHNDGTIYGAEWSTGGRHGSCLLFERQGEYNGDSARILLDDVNFMAGPYTVEAWIRPRTIGRRQTILSFYGYSDQIPMYIRDDGRVAVRVRHNDPSYSLDVIGTTILEPNCWYHVAGVWDGNEMAIWVNGVKENSEDPLYDPDIPIDNVLDIGKFRSAQPFFFNGYIDEVRVSCVARTFHGCPCIRVQPVALDIKPQSCPNPLNVKVKGENTFTSAGRGTASGMNSVLPVAVLGSADFDVADINPGSIFLEGIAPLRWSMEDVSTPMSAGAKECECTTAGADGYADLTLKFNRSQVAAALGSVMNGDEIALTLTADLVDGTPIEGTDCVIIRAKRDNPVNATLMAAGGAEDLTVSNRPNPFNASTVISYTLGEGGQVSIEVFDVLGRRVTSLIDRFQAEGPHAVTWDGTDHRGSQVASGMYFYRLRVGPIFETRKMVLLK
jgi:hypothetical protein